jgi:hydrogenase maturation protease
MTEPHILVACIGNIFLGDDGFGVEVARRMTGRSLPPGVVLKDSGIRGIDLTYALLDRWDLVVLVDACPRGGEPGSVYLIEPDPVDAAPTDSRLETHGLNPMNVLRMAKSMGGAQNRILIVGCEPADLGSDEEGKLGLSDAVAGAIDEAIRLIEKVISGSLGRQTVGAATQ